MNELHLFAGAGGGILGGILLGHTCVCAVEIEPYCRKVLLQRQRDRILPKFPIWDDVRTFDGRPWRGLVDVVCGGFPCQDISAANPTGRGINGIRSGLWVEMRRVVCEVRPRIVLVENSPMLLNRGLGRVLGDLAGLGFHARWGVLSAGAVGARHLRRRIFVVGHTGKMDNPYGLNPGCLERLAPTLWGWTKNASIRPSDGRGAWAREPAVARVAYGVANRVDRLKAIGNGQVPAVVRLAWETLSQ